MKLGMENRNQETQRKLRQHLRAFSISRSLFHLPRTVEAIA